MEGWQSPASCLKPGSQCPTVQSPHCPTYQAEVQPGLANLSAYVLRYEKNLISCYEAEYHLSMTLREEPGNVGHANGLSYPDSSEVLVVGCSSPHTQPSHVWERSPPNPLSSALRESVPMSQEDDTPSFARAKLGIVTSVNMDESEGCQMGGGYSIVDSTSPSKLDSMEMDNTSSCWAPQAVAMVPTNGYHSLSSNSLHKSLTQTAAVPDYQRTLSIQKALTPFYTSSRTEDILISHHDGPRRKKACIRQPEY